MAGREVYCPDCAAPLLLKKSKRGRYFFVHRRSCNKDCGESSAHRFWKRYICQQLKQYKAREEAPTEKRRVDILAQNRAIEIQFSNIRAETFAQRIEDYDQMGLEQYWLFKFAKGKENTLKLSPMQMYLWKQTKLPLLYIDVQRRVLIHIRTLQFVQRNCALYTYEIILIKNIPLLKQRSSFSDHLILQRKWVQFRRKHMFTFNQNQRLYQTKVGRALYELGRYHYRIEHFGIGYSGNVCFTVSPFVWQIELVHLYLIQNKSREECCLYIKRYMIEESKPLLKSIVEQVLERFLAMLA